MKKIITAYKSLSDDTRDQIAGGLKDAAALVSLAMFIPGVLFYALAIKTYLN